MKRAIIVGASGMLGGETSKLLLAKGYDVIGLSRTKPASKIKYVKLDLTDEKSVRKAADVIISDYPEFDFLINCAAIMSIQPSDAISYKTAENVFKVNVIGPMIFISHLIPLIKKNNADVVNVGSTVGFKPYQDQCAYSSSKWAVRGLTENIRLELKDTKCRVIGFNPGGFKSKMFEKATGKKPDLSGYMEPNDIAKSLVQILELPKNVEVSDVVINRKK